MGGAWGAVIVAVLVWLGGAAAAHADKRVALVIGNSAYQTVAQLPNPANDARAFATMLKGVGFDSVEVRTDLGIEAFRQTLRDFTARATDADVAVFFYAGHGLEVGGINLLVPVDARLRTDLDAEDEAVSVDRVLRALESARRLRLVVLDACRDNPFVPAMKRVSASRSVNRGFERIDAAPPDTMIAFATEPGSVAADGDGRNSPFTTALIGDLATPGLDLRIALGKVRDDVLKATGGKQRPYVTGSLGGSNQSLVPATDIPVPIAGTPVPAEGTPVPAAEPLPRPVPAPEAADSTASDFKFAEGLGSADGWQAFLRAHPAGPLADVARSRIASLGDTAGLGDTRPAAPPPEREPAPPPSEPRSLPPVSSSRYVVGNLAASGDNFLSLRGRPGTAAPELRRLPAGTGLTVDDESGPWRHVRTDDGDSGWVSSRYLVARGAAPPRSSAASGGDYYASPSRSLPHAGAPPAGGYGYVTGLDPYGDNFLALKAAPDTGAARLKKMGPGTKLRVLGRSGAWAEVELLDGTQGWAASRYIGCCKAY